MAGLLHGESTYDGTSEDGYSRSSQDKQEEISHWYMSRKEIEDNSPSRRDGINLKKETYLRKSYCKFLQDLGERLKVPQITIATAILFCHRFFLCNSHSKNDRMIIATVCMFLAGKVEESRRPLQDVVLVSYEIAFRKDPTAAKRIKQKEVYEQRKEIILIGERLVLATLGYDLIVHHPYKPLVQVTKKLKITQNDVPRVAWNFVNDGLVTTLCLQFKPLQIAAGAIFLAAKFLKVKLPSERSWWQELHVNPRQLEEISNQMLELYDQRKVPLSHVSGEEAGFVGGSSHPSPAKMAAVIENESNDKQKGEAANIFQSGISLMAQDQYCDRPLRMESDRDLPDISRSRTENAEEDKEKRVCRNETADVEEQGNDSVSYKSGSTVGPNLELSERSDGQTPKGPIEIDQDKVEAQLEKWKKFHAETTRKKDEMNKDNLVGMDSAESVQLVVEGDQNRRSWSKTDDQCQVKDFDETGTEQLTVGRK